MATAEECREALDKFAASIAANNDQVKRKLSFERRLACDIPDLDHSFHGRFSEGSLVDISDGDDPTAEIRMTVDSDDLVALVDGRLEFGKAFTSGRVKVKASLMDLLKLKGML
jgi:putative sterol carrier protein